MAVTKRANTAQNVFDAENNNNKKCNLLGRDLLSKKGEKDSRFPACTLTAPVCHCSACEMVLVIEEKLTSSASC